MAPGISSGSFAASLFFLKRLDNVLKQLLDLPRTRFLGGDFAFAEGAHSCRVSCVALTMCLLCSFRRATTKSAPSPFRIFLTAKQLCGVASLCGISQLTKRPVVRAVSQHSGLPKGQSCLPTRMSFPVA